MVKGGAHGDYWGSFDAGSSVNLIKEKVTGLTCEGVFLMKGQGKINNGGFHCSLLTCKS